MDGMQAGQERGRLAALVEQLLAEASAGAVDTAREAGWRDGYAAGRREERMAWRARLRGLLGDAEQDTTAGVAGAAAPARPPTEAGGIAPAKAAEEEAEGEAGVATAALSCDAAAPQPIGRPSNTGGEPPAPPEPLAGDDDDEDGRQEACPRTPGTEDPGPSPGAAAGAPPQVPGASAAAAASPLRLDWRTPAREARMRVLWPRDSLSHRDIWDELKLIDGPAMPSDPANLRHWARKLKLPARPARVTGQPAASNVTRGVAAAEQRAGVAAAPVLPKPSAGKVYASFREIKSWAAHHGIGFDGSNVHVVNAKRKALGLFPVVVDEDRTAADVG